MSSKSFQTPVDVNGFEKNHQSKGREKHQDDTARSQYVARTVRRGSRQLFAGYRREVGKGQVPPALVLKQIAGISDPPRTVDWILDGGLQLESEQNVAKRAIRNGIRNRGNKIPSENTNAESVRLGESGQSLQNVQIEAIFGQIVYDALRQLIREEIDAALKRVASTVATKKATRREEHPPRQ